MTAGSSKFRAKEMLSLGKAEWTLGTVLDLHYGLLDREESVRTSAVEALMDIAEKNPKPVTVSPVSLLQSVIYSFTVSSGAAPAIFRFLVKLDTPEADQAVEDLLKNSAHIRNEDFEIFIRTVIEAEKSELLQCLREGNLPKTKANIMRRILNA